MDLGLGNLTQLKAHLLAEALRSGTTYDTTLAALGKGVAARFEGHCHRKFGRVVADTHECSAARDHVVLPRYPVESVSAISLRETLATGWVDQGTVSDLVENISEAAGLVTLSSPLSALSSARLRVTYTGGYWYPTSAARTILSGSASFSVGQSTAFITFASAFDAVPAVGVTLQAPDGSPIFDVTPQAITRTGFTIALAAAAGSGYSVAWVAADASDDADASVLQSGSASLTLAAESKAITFGTAFTAAPIVFCQVVAPASGLVIACSPTLITTAGFTAPLGFPIPATGYTLNWFAFAVGATTAAPTLPSGATALPDDLTAAWLHQCALVWASLDVLGTGLSDEKARTATRDNLGKLTLSPDVAETLRRYQRHVVT